MTKFEIENERLIDGSGWLNHRIAATVGLCELHPLCTNTYEEMKNFLWDLWWLNDNKPLMIGNDICLNKLERNGEYKLYLIYKDKETKI